VRRTSSMQFHCYGHNSFEDSGYFGFLQLREKRSTVRDSKIDCDDWQHHKIDISSLAYVRGQWTRKL
ncbi:hypothetical protein BaRGS_00017893, partial [Batillaria attramentaria]